MDADGLRTPLRATAALGLIALIGTALVSAIWHGTGERIAANERAWRLRTLNELVPAQRYDNDLFRDKIEVTDRDLLGTPEPVTVYRARRNGKPAAAILAPVAPDGYSGNIRMLVAIDADGTLAGVRVTEHRETPGLGDDIEADKSDWIRQFRGLSLGDPPRPQWKVRADGGRFDQFTGATITPRAVVRRVRDTLIYFGANRERLFAAGDAATETDPELP